MPYNARATTALLCQLRDEYDFDHHVFKSRPFGERLEAEKILVQRSGAGRGRWSLDSTVRLITSGDCQDPSRIHAGNTGTAPLAELAVVRQAGTTRKQPSNHEYVCRSVRVIARPCSRERVVRDSGSDSLLTEYRKRIRTTVISTKTSGGDNTGTQAAADLLAEHGYTRKSWENWNTHLHKWFKYCSDIERSRMPAIEGDVAACTGHLSAKNELQPSSLRRYILAISR